MSAPGLPQTGWWTSEEWADALQEPQATFMRKLHRYDVPHKRWGNVFLIRAEDFYDAMPYRNGDADE
jgi:hypothetical protein